MVNKISLKNFNWGTGIFIFGYQILFIAALPLYIYFAPPGLRIVGLSVLLLALTQLGIGVYHRHYAHCGYKLSRWVEPFFLFFGTAAFQGSALGWAHDHRKHHKFVDTDNDPYSISKGFWYAHFLWLLAKPAPRELTRYVPDLLKNKLLVFQDRYYPYLAFGVNILLSLVAGVITGDFLGAFMLAWWGRLFVSHHFTWFVNSLAHYWGERTYSKEHSAVDNYMLAFFTTGEGYHNYHHTFPADYRNGIRWYHFDPNKWLIWSLSKVGLASKLLQYSDFAIQQKLLLADRNLFLKALSERMYSRKQELEMNIHVLADSIQQKIQQLKSLSEERKNAFAARKNAVRLELREAKKSIRKEWRAWYALGRTILYSRAIQ